MRLDAQLSHAPAPPVDAADPRFVRRALRACATGQPIAPVLRIAPVPAYAGLLLLALLVLTALAVAVFGSVEVSARGRGVLRAAEGTLPILAEVAGPVAQVSVRSGERVEAGQLLMRIDAAPIAASLAESERRLQFLDQQGVAAQQRLEALDVRRRQGLSERAALLQQRINQQNATLQRLDQRKATYDDLRARGFISEGARDDVLERRDEAVRLMLSLKDELTRVRGEVAQLEADAQLARLRWSEDRDGAAARRDAAQTLLRQSRIVAAHPGVVESVAVRVGEQVMPGTPLARLVPGDAPSTLVSFIAERERAFLRIGAVVRVEVDQWPAGEFGALRGRVLRIAADTATPEELRDILSDSQAAQGPYYRVEVGALTHVGNTAFKLRPGMRATLRFHLRDRRLITFVLEPLKKWLS